MVSIHIDRSFIGGEKYRFFGIYRYFSVGIPVFGKVQYRFCLSATPDSEKFAKNREEDGKNQEKSGKNQEKLGKKEEKSGSFFHFAPLDR